MKTSSLIIALIVIFGGLYLINSRNSGDTSADEDALAVTHLVPGGTKESDLPSVDPEKEHYKVLAQIKENLSDVYSESVIEPWLVHRIEEERLAPDEYHAYDLKSSNYASTDESPVIAYLTSLGFEEDPVNSFKYEDERLPHYYGYTRDNIFCKIVIGSYGYEYNESKTRVGSQQIHCALLSEE